MYGEDLDLSLRLRLAGWEVGVARGAVVEHDYEFAKGEQQVVPARAQPLADGARRLPGGAAGGAAAGAAGGRGRRSSLAAARGGWLGAKLRAQRWRSLRGLPARCGAARAVQAAATVSASEFAAGLTAGSTPRSSAPRRQIRPLAAAQAAYWRLVRSALIR